MTFRVSGCVADLITFTISISISRGLAQATGSQSLMPSPISERVIYSSRELPLRAYSINNGACSRGYPYKHAL
jgi:hypothetical protein